MIAHIIAATSSLPIGNLFKEKMNFTWFEMNTPLHVIFDSFIHYRYDFVIITDGSAYIGIVSKKEMIQIVEDFENLFRPVHEFTVSSWLVFDKAQTIDEVLKQAEKQHHEKIIIQENQNVLGLIDYNDLLGICFKKITALINHEYHFDEVSIRVKMDENTNYA